MNRRDMFKILGASAVGLSTSSLFGESSASKIGKPFKIGFVSPQTGPLAIFSESDKFTIEQVKKTVGKGILIGDTIHPLEILYKDSQSNSNRAAEVASQLILDDKVDLMLANSTPATTNPVADQCELNGVPCITNDTPWQPHFFGRGGDPKEGFEWTYHFFWGLEDIIGSYTNLWEQTKTNKVVGALWPNDSDGNAWADKKRGFPPVLKEKGFKLVDPGRIQLPANDFSSIIYEFKKQGVEIVTGVIPPPDFANFWTQAGQQGFHPKIVTVAKATEFAAAIAPFGKRADGLSVEVWWSPSHPFTSGLTNQTSAQLAEAYTKATGKEWSMPLGLKHSLFEVAIDVLKRSKGPKNPESIRDAIANTDYASIVGHINFKTGPVPNISKTPLVSGQWSVDGKNMNLSIVENSQAPAIKIQKKLKALN
ncbi:MAG: ABC transporter substrate-binding protein [Epsilonproteobacteria bacterium]|nr:MAG: ABC transporter substrate-binding protein [Campylobacterota bacterium]